MSQMVQVVSMEEEKGEWGFKAYKQMVKLHFKQNRHEEMMTAYKQMLTYIKSAVTRNYSEKVINKILDLVSTSQQMELLQELYETTLATLVEAKNERLWFKTNLKLGKLWCLQRPGGPGSRHIHRARLPLLTSPRRRVRSRRSGCVLCRC